MKNGKLWRLLLCCLLTLSTLEGMQAAKQKNKQQFVLILDAGHGGKDVGARGHGGQEKDINLAVTLAVGQLIREQYPHVKVLYTRHDDTFVGLQQRAQYANKNKADLFISIHTNSATNSSAAGVETYVLGLWRTEDNLRVAMRENESILLEENYQETYEGFDPHSTESYIMFELMQYVHQKKSIHLAQAIQKQLALTTLPDRGVRQAGFLVIRETAMPSVLVELGFISNAKEAAYLLSQEGQRKHAEAIVRGFGTYYEAFRHSQEGSTTSR